MTTKDSLLSSLKELTLDKNGFCTKMVIIKVNVRNPRPLLNFLKNIGCMWGNDVDPLNNSVFNDALKTYEHVYIAVKRYNETGYRLLYARYNTSQEKAEAELRNALLFNELKFMDFTNFIDNDEINIYDFGKEKKDV